MDFGQAIQAMKDGKAVAREGWNGKNMYIYLVYGSMPKAGKLRGQAFEHVGSKHPRGHDLIINPHIDMKAADGSIVVGWLASQTDMLSEDWVIV